MKVIVHTKVATYLDVGLQKHQDLQSLDGFNQLFIQLVKTV